jgi:exocyst complex component 4
MSRTPLFSPRRRSPSRTNGISISVPSPFSPPGTSTTRPLQILRQPDRPVTPTSDTFNTSRTAPPNPTSTGPSRPQRSELRSRTSDYSGSEHLSASYRDSISTMHSDISSTQKSRPGSSTNPSTPSKSRPKLQRLQSVSSDDSEQTTPASLISAMSAFQSAGSRRRAMTNESEDREYEIERQNQLQAEKDRQQRIRDKVPGRRTNGKARAGDIDGKHCSLVFTVTLSLLFYSVSCLRPSQR